MRPILTFIGILSTVLAVIGIFLPILPTTPFLLLASWLFYRSNPKLRTWLINHHILGSYIKNYIVYKAIPMKAKITTIAMLWMTISFAIYIARDKLWLQILLAVIAICVTIHIVLLNTLENNKEKHIITKETKKTHLNKNTRDNR